MCKFFNRCELYEAEHCDIATEPHEDWPCYGSNGSNGLTTPDNYEHTAAYYNDTDRNQPLGTYREPLLQAAGQLVPVHCELCGCLTGNTGTKLCDRCYALKIRVEANPSLAQQIIDNLNHKGE